MAQAPGSPPGSPPGGAPSGLGSSLRQLSGTVLDIARTRLALLATEVEEEKRRLLAVMAWGGFGILMGSVALVSLAAFVTVLFWDTHRLLVLGLLTLGFVGLCTLAAWQVRTLLGESAEPLRETLAELDADRKALQDGPLP